MTTCGLYPVPQSDCGSLFEKSGCGRHHSVPTYHHKRLFDAVEQALDSGLFHTGAIYPVVTKSMSDVLSPDLLAKGTEYSKNGFFWFEVYGAKEQIIRNRERAGHRMCLRNLIAKGLIANGQTINGTYQFNNKRYGKIVVNEVIDDYGLLGVTLTRRGCDRVEAHIGVNETAFVQLLVPDNGRLIERKVEGVSILDVILDDCTA